MPKIFLAHVQHVIWWGCYLLWTAFGNVSWNALDNASSPSVLKAFSLGSTLKECVYSWTSEHYLVVLAFLQYEQSNNNSLSNELEYNFSIFFLHKIFFFNHFFKHTGNIKLEIFDLCLAIHYNLQKVEPLAILGRTSKSHIYFWTRFFTNTLTKCYWQYKASCDWVKS